MATTIDIANIVMTAGTTTRIFATLAATSVATSIGIFATLAGTTTRIFATLAATSIGIFTVAGVTVIGIFTVAGTIGIGTFSTAPAGTTAEEIMTTVRQAGFSSTYHGGMGLAIVKRQVVS